MPKNSSFSYDLNAFISGGLADKGNPQKKEAKEKKGKSFMTNAPRQKYTKTPKILSKPKSLERNFSPIKQDSLSRKSGTKSPTVKQTSKSSTLKIQAEDIHYSSKIASKLSEPEEIAVEHVGKCPSRKPLDQKLHPSWKQKPSRKHSDDQKLASRKQKTPKSTGSPFPIVRKSESLEVTINPIKPYSATKTNRLGSSRQGLGRSTRRPSTSVKELKSNNEAVVNNNRKNSKQKDVASIAEDIKLQKDGCYEKRGSALPQGSGKSLKNNHSSDQKAMLNMDCQLDGRASSSLRRYALYKSMIKR